MRISTLFWLLVVFCAGFSLARAQAPRIFPPAPTTAALGKYGDVPVSTYTGIPSIGIPLYTITSGDLTLPIALSYHAGGIKVEEDASWVGLGWSLNAGGVITHSIRDKDDFGSLGFAHSPAIPVTPNSQWIGDNLCPAAAADSRRDLEPDIFYYNFAGYSGKFFLTPTGEVRLFKDAKIRLQYFANQDGIYWVITTPEGTRYSFRALENTTTYAGSGGSAGLAAINIHRLQYAISAWYLTQVQSAAGSTIGFEYAPPRPAFSPVYTSETRYQIYDIEGSVCPNNISIALPTTCNGCPTFSASQTLTDVINLQRITFPAGHLDFITSDRLDVRTYGGGGTPQKLQRLELYHGAALRKSFELTYGYYAPPTTAPEPPSPATAASALQYRLRLDAVQEASGPVVLPPHRFYYNTRVALPAKNSTGQDHWGYYNGYDGNFTMIPSFEYTKQGLAYANQIGSFTGGNREVDTAKAQAGILRQITYPTGGSSTFGYEANSHGEDNQVQAVERMVQVGAGPVSPANPTYSYGIPVDTFTVRRNTLLELTRSIHCEEACATQQPRACQVPDGGYGEYAVFKQLSPYATQAFTDHYYYYDEYIQHSEEILTSGGGDCLRQVISSFTIPPGTYQLQVLQRGGFEVRLQARFLQQVPVAEKPGGGLRVASITTVDGLTGTVPQVKRFAYTRKDSPDKSSGRLMSPISYYAYQNYEAHFSYCPNAGQILYGIAMASQSNVPLGNSAQGSAVGYDRVTVSNELTNANGYTTYEYLNLPDQVALPQVYGNTTVDNALFPGFPTVQNQGNGMLFREAHFTQAGQPVREVVHDPVLGRADDEDHQVIGLRAVDPDAGHYASAEYDQPLCSVVAKTYDLGSQWWYDRSTTERLYDPADPTSYHETTTRYYYDNPEHQQLTRSVQRLRDSTDRVTQWLYPADYAPGTPFLDDMVRAYQHALPVEKVTYQTAGPGAPAVVLAGEATRYQPGGRGLRAEALAWERAAPLPISEFKFSNAAVGAAPPTAAPGPFALDGHYRRKMTYDRYDAQGNLEQYTPDKGSPVAYVWGYNRAYPVAEARNATYADVVRVLGQAVVDGLTGAAPGPDAAVRQQLQPLREQLPRAQVRTATYAPLQGSTSSTDPSGRTIFYEYDALGRLVRTRDDQGRILSQQQYHYAGK